MRQQPLDVKIDEHTYKIGHWPVDKQAENLAWLLISFGPAFKGIFEATENADKYKSDSEMGIAFLDVVVSNISSILTPKEYAAKLKELVEGVLCDNSPIIYNNHFTGRLLHLHKVLFQVLRFQYADFLDVALANGLRSQVTPS